MGPFGLGVDEAPGRGADAAPLLPRFADPMPPELDANPRGAYSDEGGPRLAWQPARADDFGWVDFNALYGGDFRIGYALVYLRSPDDRLVLTLMQGDGLMRVFVNGVSSPYPMGQPGGAGILHASIASGMEFDPRQERELRERLALLPAFR